jgi:CheY-like chemotaxis protein/PAS domain-containing protein
MRPEGIGDLPEFEGVAPDTEPWVRALLEGHLQGVAVCDGGGRVLDANDAFLRITGHSRRDLRAGSIECRDLVLRAAGSPVARADAVQGARTLGPGPTSGELTLVRADGASTPVLASFVHGVLPGRDLVFVQDLTESHRRAAHLRMSQLELQLALEVAPIELWEIGADGLVESASGGRTAATVAGTGRPIEDLWRDRPLLLALARRALAGESLDEQLLEGGRHLRVRARPLDLSDGGGGRPGALVAAFDASAERETEEERQLLERRVWESQGLQTAGFLVGGLAHQFNNLLTGVLSNISSAQQLSATPAGAEALADAMTSARAAADLTQQLLATAATEPAPALEIDLSGLLQGLRPLLSAAVPRRVQFQLEPGAALPRVVADPGLLRQALLALVTVAVRAAALQGGRVRVSTGLVELQQDQGPLEGGARLAPGWYVSLAVEDDEGGSGLAPRPATGLLPPGPDRSLGLAAIVNHLRALRGAVRVRATPRGTRVELLLPPTDQEPRKRPKSLPEGPAPSRSVLVVEDDPAVRRSAERVLALAGLEVRGVGCGDDALALFDLDPSPVGLVLLDFALPGMTCEQMVRALRSKRPGQRVLLCSGYSEQQATWKLSPGEVVGFLPKPFTAEELEKSVLAALDGRVILTPPPGTVARLRY